MSYQNSAQSDLIRPENLMQELAIRKDTYYNDLAYLEVKASKDQNGNAYLTNDQANRVRRLRSYVNQTGKREGFDVSFPDEQYDNQVEKKVREKKNLI